MSEMEGKRIAIYARYSTDKQNETSVADQVRVCRKYIEQLGGEPKSVEVYEDRGISAAGMDRPGIMRLREDTKGKKIDFIIAEDLSRVSREQADIATFIRDLRYYEIPLALAVTGRRTDNTNDAMAISLDGIIAEDALTKLRYRTLRGMEGRAENGYHTGGKTFGYRTEPDIGPSGNVLGYRLHIDETEAPIVQRVFTLYAQGQTRPAIAGMLNEEGIASPRSTKRGWTPSTIRGFLMNEKYIGLWKFGAKKWRKVPGTNVRRYKDRPDSEVRTFHQPHLRIIDDELWEAVKARREGIAARYAGKQSSHNRKRSNFLFSGILRCGVCGERMSICSSTGPRYYQCADAKLRKTCANRKTVREDHVRRSILDAMRSRLFGKRGIAYMRKQYEASQKASPTRPDAEQRHHAKRVAEIEGKIANLIELAANGEAPQSVIKAISKLEEELRQAKSAAQAVSLPVQPPKLHSFDETLERAKDLDRMLRRNVLAGRQALRTFFEDEQIQLLPQPDGGYIARGNFLPLVLIAKLADSERRTAQKRKTPLGAFQAASFTTGGCGGRI